MRWHFYVTPTDDGASNMALDEALMLRAARTGTAVFRVYDWSIPTLSLGRNQRARGCYDTAKAQEAGVEFVRRPTGGRALLHHHEVTYSATMPMRDATTARSAYDFINDVLLSALTRMGVDAQRATNTQSVPPGLRPCFDVPAAHEIVVAGRKLVGSAQWQHDGALLQHGSILVRDDQAVVSRLLIGQSSKVPCAATLEEAMGREPPVDEIAEALLASLESVAGVRTEPFDPDAALERDRVRLCGVYRDDAWTWRR